MDDDVLPRLALRWELDTAKQKPGRPRKTGTLHIKT